MYFPNIIDSHFVDLRFYFLLLYSLAILFRRSYPCSSYINPQQNNQQHRCSLITWLNGIVISALSENLRVSELFTDSTACFLLLASACLIVLSLITSRSARTLGNSTHTSLLVTHQSCLPQYSETGKRGVLRPAYDMITASDWLRYVRPFLTLAAHRLNVYCSIDSEPYRFAVIYFFLSILHNYFRVTVGTRDLQLRALRYKCSLLFGTFFYLWRNTHFC